MVQPSNEQLATLHAADMFRPVVSANSTGYLEKGAHQRCRADVDRR